jgi:tetratricopeptide (TPR) repeat protein
MSNHLNDALTTSFDQLIRDAGPDARRLLWVIALANEPITIRLLEGAWSSENEHVQTLRRVKLLLDNFPPFHPVLKQLNLDRLTPEVRAQIDSLLSQVCPDPKPLLGYLVAVGLANEVPPGPNDDLSGLTCHELVRERIFAWMRDHPADLADLTERAIRLAYAERLEAAFHDLQYEDLGAALVPGSRALVYYVQAGAYDRLQEFASTVITAGDLRLLESLLPHLQAAAESAPEGRSRRSCLAYLADALARSGHPDSSLPVYERAASLARAAAKVGGEDGRRAWADLAWITGNSANALRSMGDLDASRKRRLDSAEAHRQAGDSAIEIIGSELEALRIDIMQDKAAEALPQVEARLAKVEAWWAQHRSGQAVAESPDAEILARVLLSALDIARNAHEAQENYESALRRVDAMLEVERALCRPAEDIAAERMNRANVLVRLGRHSDAQSELEACLQIFRNDPPRRAAVLSSHANLCYDRGEVPQAITQVRRALAIFDQLPDPTDRATSHDNLACYLHRSGTPSAVAEAPRHRLSALVYRLVSGLRLDLQTSLYNYVVEFRLAHAAVTPVVVPRLAELLAESAFRPLDDWLGQRGVSIDELQVKVNRLVEMAQNTATWSIGDARV